MKEYQIPIEVTLDVIGGKWKTLILCQLTKNQSMRTGELKKSINGITQKMLTQQLRDLEQSGLINRKVHNTVPPCVEYSLTELGWSLKSVTDAMCSWGENYLENHVPVTDDVTDEKR